MSGIEALDYWDDDDLIAALYQDELEEAIKASFGGDRSAAGRYAANIRWKGHVKEQPASGGGDDPVSVALRDAKDALTKVQKATTIYAASVLTPDQWASDRWSDYATVTVKVRGKARVIVSKTTLEAEAKVRALGAAVHDQAAKDLIAEGFMDQETYQEWIQFNDNGPRGAEEARKRYAELSDALANKDAKVLPPGLLQALNDRESVTEEFVAAKMRVNALKKEITALNKIGYFSSAPYEERMAARDKSRSLAGEAEAAQKEARLLSSQVDDANFFFRKMLTGWQEYADVNMRAQGKGTKEERARMSDITKRLGEQSAKIMGGLVKMDGKLVYDFPVPDSQRIDTIRASKGSAVPIAISQTAGDAMRVGAAFVESSIPAAILTQLAKPRSYVRLYDYGLARQQQVVRLLPTYEGREIDGPLGFRDSAAANKMMTILIQKGAGGSFDSNSRTLRFDGDESTLLHEVGHAMTYAIPEFRLMEQAHYQNRTFGKVGDTRSFDKRLKSGPQAIAEGSGKSHNFPGAYREDLWVHPYMGRDYSSSRADTEALQPTEVLTKGLESFRGNDYYSQAVTGRIDRAATHMVIGSLIAVAANLEAQQ